ncbi:MAG: tetratricopeptide repeat protein [Candidatus Magasanikbacteria bacterium]|nr:tetratricopeptide repeat protein [Candidatus Magasanikbacteria bacterium]
MISYIFLALNVLLVPLFLDKNLNNSYIIPKQYVFGGLILINIILLILKFVLTKKFNFNKTVLDKPLLLILGLGLLSTVFSSNVYDSFFGRSDFFALSYISLLFGVLFYYVVVNFVHTEKSWKGLMDMFLASGFLSIIFFILKTVFKINFLDTWFGPALNTVDSLNSLFGVWVIMVLILSLGQVIKRGQSVIRTIIYFIIGLSAFAVLVMLNFKVLWWILLVSLVLLLMLGVNFLKEVRLPWLSVIFTFLVLNVVFIIFGVPQKLQMNVPTEVALGLKPSWSVTYDTALSGVKQFLLGSGPASFGVDFSKFRDVAFNSDNVAWSLRFSQPYNTVFGLVSEYGLALAIIFVFLILLFLGHALTAWKKIRVAANKGGNSLQSHPILLEAFLSVIAFVILSGSSFFIFYNQVIWLVWFLFLALSIVGFSFYYHDFVSKVECVMEETPQYSLSFSFGLIVAITALVMISVWGVRLYGGEFKPDVQAVSSPMAKAVNEAKVATDLSPASVGLWENLATMYENASALVPEARDWAIKTLQQVVVLEPTNPAHYWRLGNSFAAQAKWEDAVKNYQKAVDLKADYYGAYVGLANAYEQTQKNDQALTLYEKLINNKQANPEILYNYGRLFYNLNSQGDLDSDQKNWLSVIQKQPNYSNALYSLGLWYETRGDKTTALQYYYKVRDLNPNNPDILKKIQSLTGAVVPAPNEGKIEIKKK